jgi:dTDP-glucose 4,6-dehydratase
VDCSRIRTLGWVPEVNFDEGLRATIEWYKEHDAWWRRIKSGEFRAYYLKAYGDRLQGGGA